MCCDNFLFRPVFVKKAENFDFFPNSFDIAHCPKRFVNVAFVSTNVFAGSVRLLPSCSSKVVIVRVRIFGGPNFFTSAFLAKAIETHVFFQNASKLLSHFSGLYCPVWHPNAVWAMEFEAVNAFIFWPKKFLSFLEEFGRKTP